MMKSIITLGLVYIFLCPCIAQSYRNILSYRTEQGDTSNFFIYSKQTFNGSNKIIQEDFYKENLKVTYVYNDTLLISRKEFTEDKITENTSYRYNNKEHVIETITLANDTIIRRQFFKYRFNGQLKKRFAINIENSDIDKSIFHYNKRGNEIREVRWTFERRIKKSAQIGNGRKGGCIAHESDYEKKRTWRKACTRITKWNQNDKIIEWINLGYCQSNYKQTYAWDSICRIQVERIFRSNGKLFHESIYNYFEGGYQVISTTYSHDGIKAHLTTKSWEYCPLYISYCKVDEKGRLIEKKVMDEKNQFHTLYLYVYNSSDQLIQETYCNAGGTLNYSIKYKYE